MIKVALLHFCFEDYTIQLANSLAKSVELVLISPACLAPSYRDVLDPGIKVMHFQKPRIRDPRNLLAMREMLQIIREVQPDVLHVQETDDPWYDATLLFSQILFNKMPPLVTTIHDVFRHPGDRQTTPGSEYTGQIAFHRSQHLIVHTRELQAVLTQKFRIPQHRVTVLPHGELGSLYLRKASVEKPKREPHTLLFFGRIWPYKGLQYLLEAIPLVQAQIGENIKLIIAGKGEALTRYSPKGFDENSFEIINRFISTEEVIHLFLRSTATILPYIESSQSGVAALSYGFGTPVIASNIGGLREIVKDGHDGLLVPPKNTPALADAIVKVLSDSDLQQQLQMGAYQRCVQDLNWSNIAAQTIETYQKVLYAC